MNRCQVCGGVVEEGKEHVEIHGGGRQYFHEKCVSTQSEGGKDSDDSNLVDNYGQRIERARKDAGMTLEELSSRTGIGTGLLESFENGKSHPSKQHVLKLLDYLQVDLVEDESWMSQSGQDLHPDMSRVRGS